MHYYMYMHLLSHAVEEETGKLEGSKKYDCWKEYI